MVFTFDGNISGLLSLPLASNGIPVSSVKGMFDDVIEFYPESLLSSAFSDVKLCIVVEI